MSSHLIFFLRWLLMRCLLMRNLLTFSTKKSRMSRYLKSSLLTSLHRFIHQGARRLLMSDLFVEKVSRFLSSRHLMSSHLKKEMRWLLMRCLLTTSWTGLLSYLEIQKIHMRNKISSHIHIWLQRINVSATLIFFHSAYSLFILQTHSSFHLQNFVIFAADSLLLDF